MTQTMFAALTPRLLGRASRVAGSLILASAFAVPALADDPKPKAPVVAEDAPTNTPNPPLTPERPELEPTTTLTTQTPAPSDRPNDFGGSLSIETSVGIGSFVSEPQTNSVVTTSFSPSGWFQLAQDLKLTAGFSFTWFQVLDIDTPLSEGDVLLSDISIGVSHARIVHDDSTSFNLSGSLRVGLPTSLASQFQNRLFTLSTGLTASIPAGPVSFSYSLGFGKYFNLTATPTVDCDDFDNPDECIQGRSSNPSFGFESERRGPEIFLPGQGASSFYLTNSLAISWAIIDELSLSLGISISNSYGVRAFPIDELSNEHATAGRSHRDRLTSSLGLDYSIDKYLAVGASLVTDTAAPFGADGNDFPVIFDFTRASDNITSINISVTGSL